MLTSKLCIRGSRDACRDASSKMPAGKGAWDVGWLAFVGWKQTATTIKIKNPFLKHGSAQLEIASFIARNITKINLFQEEQTKWGSAQPRGSLWRRLGEGYVPCKVNGPFLTNQDKCVSS